MFRSRKDVETVRPPAARDGAPSALNLRKPVEARGGEPARAVNGPPMKPAADQPPSDPAVAEGKRLTVGRGISLSGEITACDRLIVEGEVQVTLVDTKAIEITATGRFTNGKAEVEEAVVSGLYEGQLTVRDRLVIKSTGTVRGDVRYGQLEIETGGQLSGNVARLDPA